MAIEKVCVFCEHLEFDYDTGNCPTCDYGTYAKMSCAKNRWETDINYSLVEYRQFILQAAKCPDYEQVES